MSDLLVKEAVIVPGLPQPLLTPDANPGYKRLHDAYAQAGEKLRAAKPDVMVIYSTMWPSIIGHQVQTDPEPEWVHVDELFHDLGSIPYKFRIDTAFGEGFVEQAKTRGLRARGVSYHGFPIDTGSIVALKLLNPNNEIPAAILSSNVYSDRAETVVAAKASLDALRQQGKTAAVVLVSTLSNRLFTDWIDPSEDKIHSQKDDEWNRKIMEMLADGRLEDVSQLSREIQRQIRVAKVVNFKPMWWLSTMMGNSNKLDGQVLAYEPVMGAGCAVISLTPRPTSYGDLEYDEEDVDVYTGDREVLDKAEPQNQPVASQQPVANKVDTSIVRTDSAPKPVGAYPHARRVGNLLYLSGVGPRDPKTDAVPGGPVVSERGEAQDYDIQAQTRGAIENVRRVLNASGLDLEDVVDVTGFLINMERDFKGYNSVYAEYFVGIQAARTTLAITALPTPIAVEFKVIAQLRPEAQYS